jgi:hypothetical protein
VRGCGGGWRRIWRGQQLLLDPGSSDSAGAAARGLDPGPVWAVGFFPFFVYFILFYFILFLEVGRVTSFVNQHLLRPFDGGGCNATSKNRKRPPPLSFL